jgi:hypothetical protein
VGKQLFGTFTCRGGRKVPDKTFITVDRAAPPTEAAAPSSSSVLARFLVVPCCHGKLLRNSGMAACAFNFFREGSPWLRTWASLARLAFVLLCGVTAAKCALMSGDVLVFLFFLAGPDPLSGRADCGAISSSAARVWGSDPSSPCLHLFVSTKTP